MRTRYVIWSSLWHVIREDAVFLTKCGRKAPPRSQWSDARPNGILCRRCETDMADTTWKPVTGDHVEFMTPGIPV